MALWEGLSIELWQAVVQDLGVAFELREYSLGQILDAAEKDEIDVIIASVVTEQRELIMDYSQPFITSGSAIAVPADPPGHSWLHIAERLLLLNFCPSLVSCSCCHWQPAQSYGYSRAAIIVKCSAAEF
ncbi:MAG: transporter substrate-binding domain-containing protein [Deltaproteobacteria bacterium]|nr:transporter substrate-binding domain-containing protein [Deltaproteobacteria bacterium]